MQLKKINIFNKLNILEYKNLLKKFNLNLDIYYQPNYLKIESTLLKGEFEIFTINNKNKFIKIFFESLKVSPISFIRKFINFMITFWTFNCCILTNY